MKTVEVKFNDNSYDYRSRGKSYHYLVDNDFEIAARDTAVVHNGSELRLVTVLSVSAGMSAKATKTIVCVVSKEDIAKYHENNKKLVYNKRMFQRLEQLLAQESEVSKYRRLAENNSEAAEILTKLGIV